ncbi:hypothetical protein ACH5RR_033041 [Cinchona calisaya]|uniref:Uncharacterized protein n=1 Tax=Cinchona calisaya TaxID=153742 RepID=A0ABD2YJT9_9GENT
MSNISLLALFLGIVVLATPSTSTKFEREAIERLYIQARAIVDNLVEETLPLKGCLGKAIEIHAQVKKYLHEALSPSKTIDIHVEINLYFSKVLEAIKELEVQVHAKVDTLGGKTTKHHLAPLPSEGWKAKATEIHKEANIYLNKVLPPSKTLDVHGEINNYFQKALEAVELLHVQAQELVNTTDNETINRHLSPLPSKEWESSKTVELNKKLRNYLNKALSPSQILNTDDVKNYFDKALPPLEIWDIDEKAENYHYFSLSPADKLEEKAAEMVVDVQT